MNISRMLDRLQSGTERYVHHAKAGRKDRLLSASLFDLCDSIRERTSEHTKEIAAKVSTETERLVRLIRAADSTEFYEAWARQRDAIADYRKSLASNRTD